MGGLKWHLPSLTELPSLIALFANHAFRIPFERALDFANKEKITELLYPLFVHNIGALLYHPTNQPRTSQVMAAAERRKQEQNQLRNAQPSAGLPSLQQHHHSMALPGPQTALPSHPGMGRPSLDRAHTFPTPPTSASGVMGGMGTSDSFQWNQQGMSSAQPANPMSIDTGLSNARSMPTTPATTPPGANIQSIQPYPPATQPPYDSARQMYSAPPSQHSSYPPTNPASQDRSIYGQAGYVKSEMGPPAARPVTAVDQADSKPPNGILHPSHGDQVPAPGGEEEAEHEHDGEYTHDSGAYDANRAPYSYSAPPVPSLPGDHSHISPELTGSPHQAGSGRATPRTAAPPQPYYTQQGYNTPPRVPPSSSLYNMMSNDRAPSNGTSTGDVYAPPADMGGSITTNGYAPQPPILNGSSAGLKRSRDDDDDKATALASLDPKRRKTFSDPTIPSLTFDASLTRTAPPPIATQQRRR